ncbi:MAG: endonuclease [Acholeplasmatales bacterium]|nr:endonuclease [Acholeplasmatales bacterium]
MPTRKESNFTSNKNDVKKRQSTTTKKSSSSKVGAAVVTAAVLGAVSKKNKKNHKKRNTFVLCLLLLLVIAISVGGIWWYTSKVEVWFMDESQIEYIGTSTEEYYKVKDEVRYKQTLEGKLPDISELLEDSEDYYVRWFDLEEGLEWDAKSSDAWEHKTHTYWDSKGYYLILVAYFYESAPKELPSITTPPLNPTNQDDIYPSYSGDYYENITTPTVNVLNMRLHDGFSPTSYKDAGSGGMLLIADNPPYNILDTFDSNKNADFIEELDLVYGIYDSQGFALTWANGKNFEREHVWPNGRLGMPRVTSTNKNQASDLHNLRAIGGVYTGSINQKRSDRYFVDDITNPILPHTVGSYAFYPGYKHIGDVARILLYQYIMYKDILKLPSSESDLINYKAYSLEGTFMPIWSEDNLRILSMWNYLDPVDDFEEHRNDCIYAFQGNRNPFIDKPSWFNIIVSELSLAVF